MLICSLVTAKPVLGNLALFEPVVAGTMVFLVPGVEIQGFFSPGVDSSFFFWKNSY